jgi:hypothetical protein
VASFVRRWMPGWKEQAPRPGAPASGAGPPAVALPAIFHVTHWKAGSQWRNKILNRCVGDRVVFAEDDTAQFLHRPLLAGHVYTTCYVTRHEFYSVRLPEPWRRFVVIRDLRDTLVSLLQPEVQSRRCPGTAAGPRAAECRGLRGGHALPRRG